MLLRFREMVADARETFSDTGDGGSNSESGPVPSENWPGASFGQTRTTFRGSCADRRRGRLNLAPVAVLATALMHETLGSQRRVRRPILPATASFIRLRPPS